MSELADIRAFVEVVNSGGFSEAARRLGISKSIVSRRVSSLEQDLGAQLISRTTRGVSPTEAGLEFKERGSRILAELDEARELVARSGDTVVGQLRVAAPMSFLNQVGPVLADLAAAHPRLKVDAAFSDSRVDLVAEGFDCAIRIGSLPDSTLVARRIAPIGAVLVASPDYLDRAGRPSAPEDLTRHECLARGGLDVWRLRRNGEEFVVRPTGRFRADSGMALMQAAAAGLGVAGLPTFMLHEHIASGRLEPVLRDFELPEESLFLVRPPGPAPGKVRALTELLVERFGGEPYWDLCRSRGRC